jgi:hypothetical protein
MSILLKIKVADDVNHLNGLEDAVIDDAEEVEYEVVPQALEL